MDTKLLFRAVCGAAAQNVAVQAAKKVVVPLAINAIGRAGGASVAVAIPVVIPAVVGLSVTSLIDNAISLVRED